MPDAPVYLFTAFEPSGDAHAAPVIAELLRRVPEAQVLGTGGPKMQAAGATLIAETVGNAAMGLSAVGRVFEHKRVVQQVRDRLRELGSDQLTALVPVDSPAANWSFCELIRKEAPRAKVYHLVAPQLWAWGEGRIKKLRRLSDGVMCLLPFEPEWFAARDMRATFVGHPLYEQSRSTAARPFNDPPVVALLPGSRRAEVNNNWPTMLAAFEGLRKAGLDVHGVVAANDERTKQQVEHTLTKADGLVMDVTVGQAQDALLQADVTLVVSGTASLQTAAARCPMVILYNASYIGWQVIGRHLIRTRTFTLPNLIGEHLGLGRVVPEFVPHFADPRPIAEALRQLIEHPHRRENQARAFEKIAACYDGVDYAASATDFILNQP